MTNVTVGNAATNAAATNAAATNAAATNAAAVTKSSTLEWSTTGVGPWVGTWPEGGVFDPQLLELGDTRNVIDRYRYWRMDAIVADLDQGRHPFHVAIENWQHDMNIG